MATTRKEVQALSTYLEKPEFRFGLCFVCLLIVVFLFNGKPVPFNNEYVYLLRLKPDFLLNDWTFSVPANEHWLFNTIFAVPARFLSLEVLGWLGRLLVWSLCLVGLIRLGRLWEIPFWAISVSICVWLAIGQTVENGEWIFGGFEAKTVAYSCLLFSLYLFCQRKILLPAIFLGLTFSFHPAVGLWAIPAVGIALLFQRLPVIDFFKVVALTCIFSLPGIIPLVGDQTTSNTSSFDTWHFIVTKVMPWHLDPYYFSRKGIVLLYVMTLFGTIAFWKSKVYATRFLLIFQIVLGVFYTAGLILRWLELYPLLRFMPMRLFPVFALIFFCFTFFYLISRLNSATYKTLLVVFFLGVISVLFLIGPGFGPAKETISLWKAPESDLQKANRWIAENTDKGAVVASPPNGKDTWFISQRANVASYRYPTYERLDEWRERIGDLTGNFPISSGDNALNEIEVAFNELSVLQIGELKKKYGVTYLISQSNYPFPKVFETETYKIYRLTSG